MDQSTQQQSFPVAAFHTLAVLGAGAMGRGIVETAAVHGLSVQVYEVSDAAIASAEERLRKSISRGIERGKLNLASVDEALARVAWHRELQGAAAGAEFVIEAVPEDFDLKAGLFRELDAVCPPQVILASNTSSISMTRLAAQTGRPSKVIGMHFFNPVPVMAPVEIVPALQTSAETIAATEQLSAQLGKQSFVVQDQPGFAVNRVLMPMINEAVFALQEGVAPAETIDSLMKLGCNQPMGPLELADFIGLDVCLSILQVLHRELGDPKFRPCPLLVRMVAAGRLGRKTGQGFHRYQ